MSIAVLDIGKTNVKLVVVDGDGTERHSVTRPNRALPGPPYPNADVEGIWSWLLEALADAGRDHAIDTIVPVAHGACAALIAGNELALPVLDYEHDGPDRVHRAYADAIDPFAQTLSPLLRTGLNVGKQLFWQRHAFPEAFARATTLLMWPQYWSWRLSGVAAAEVTSLGCHTHLWRPDEGAPSGFAEREGLAALLPPLRSAWDCLGPIRPEVAAQTGLDPACRILCGIHDSNASYLPHIARRPPPFTVLSTGTWVICMAAGGAIDRLDERRDMLANVDAAGAAVPCARFMGGREFATLAGTQAPAVPAGIADVQAVIDAGTLALPSFAPESGPFQGREGRIVGTAPRTSAGRAALASLYCALVARTCLDALAAAGPILVEGSFARNTAFLGILAALRPEQAVFAVGDATGTVSGAALLAAWPDAPVRMPAAAPVEPLPVRGLSALADRWRAGCADAPSAAVRKL